VSGDVVVMVTVWSDGTATADNPQRQRGPVLQAKDLPTLLKRLTKVTNQRKLGLR
jgi:hypothetical protein